ncbi:MAG TPA: globin [Taishania sp.]|nr:globin [Taishania sp.]
METFYQKIGSERLSKVLDLFYDQVFSSPVISHLFKDSRESIQMKQFKFLVQFLGGPQLYTLEHGHPKMRMRHLPHRIDEKAKTEWLRCMRIAIDQVFHDDPELGNQFYNIFPPIAEHMKNS